MTSHHDKSKINFLCSLGETWSATPGPRKHPVLAPSSRQSLTLRLVAEQQLLGSHFSKEPGPLQNHPGRPHQDPTVRILPCLPTGLPCAGISSDIGAFELQAPNLRHGSIDRSVARALRPYSDHAPSVQIQHRRGFCDEISLGVDLSSRLWRANCKEIELSSSFRCRKSGFVRGGLGGAGFEARLEPPSSSSSLFFPGRHSCEIRLGFGLCR